MNRENCDALHKNYLTFSKSMARHWHLTGAKMSDELHLRLVWTSI
jgi:hypothetical protein